MPDQDESTPAPIPQIDPQRWEKHEGFRETLLLHFTHPKANRTLRDLGDLLFDLSLKAAPSWPHHSEGETRAELRAAVADLRHLEGFLASVGREHVLSSLSPADEALSRFAAGEALEVRAIALQIEEELSRWTS
jgi:hypothetical protein